MPTTNQPVDLDRIRRALLHYARTGSDDAAHDLLADIAPLVAEIERLRDANDRMRNQHAPHCGAQGPATDCACGGER